MTAVITGPGHFPAPSLFICCIAVVGLAITLNKTKITYVFPCVTKTILVICIYKQEGINLNQGKTK